MSDYYFDIETYTKTKKPDVKNDAIIAITYRQIDSRTGEPKNKLNILKCWESSEKEILQEFYPIFFNPEDKWKFVPIGCNLSFDFASLIYRYRKMNVKINVKNLFVEHPYIDIQSILIMFNKGTFTEASLEKYAGKQYPGTKVTEWYDKKDYQAIQAYIEDEADRFLKLYQFLVRRLPSVWLEFAKETGIII